MPGIETLTVGTLAIIFLAIGIGSVTKGITGIGLPILAVPIMATFLGVERTVLIMIIPGVVANIWMIWSHRDEAAILKRLWPFLLPAVAGGAVGSFILVWASDRALILLLAAVLGGYLLLRWRNPHFRIAGRLERWLSPIAGFASGTLQGTNGISSPIIAPYIHALDLAPRTYVFSVTAIFLVCAFGQFPVLLHLGVFTADRAIEGAIALIPVFAGQPIGMWLAKSISRQTFDRILITTLSAMELKLLYDGLIA